MKITHNEVKWLQLIKIFLYKEFLAVVALVMITCTIYQAKNYLQRVLA